MTHFCGRCGAKLVAGRDVCFPGGDETCVEGACPGCGVGFTTCYDGCPVRDGKQALWRVIAMLTSTIKSGEAWSDVLENEIARLR